MAAPHEGLCRFCNQVHYRSCKANIGDRVNVGRQPPSSMYICTAGAWVSFSNRLSNVLETIIYPNPASPQSHKRMDPIERLQCNKVPSRFRLTLFTAFQIIKVHTESSISSRTASFEFDHLRFPAIGLPACCSDVHERDAAKALADNHQQ